jgi:hypothetical protein
MARASTSEENVQEHFGTATLSSICQSLEGDKRYIFDIRKIYKLAE